MAALLDRRTLLRRAAIGGGALIAGPLQAYAARTAAGRPPAAPGYGPLVDRGELALPLGFDHRVISRAGLVMTDGTPTPTAFDGMAAFRGPRHTTILIRNHENRSGPGNPDPDEIPVFVPAALRYDAHPAVWGGNT